MGVLSTKFSYTTPVYEVCFQTKRIDDTKCTVWLPDELNVCTDLQEALRTLENIRKGVKVGKNDEWKLIELDAVIVCGQYFGVRGKGRILDSF